MIRTDIGNVHVIKSSGQETYEREKFYQVKVEDQARVFRNYDEVLEGLMYRFQTDEEGTYTYLARIIDHSRYNVHTQTMFLGRSDIFEVVITRRTLREKVKATLVAVLDTIFGDYYI